MIFEVSTLGGKVVWVQCASLDEVQDAIAGTGAACWGEVLGDVPFGEIDYATPVGLRRLRRHLMEELEQSSASAER